MPVLDDLGAKLSQIYSKNQADAEKAGAARKTIDLYEKVPPPAQVEPSKWKMMFPKDSDSPHPPVQTIHVTKLGAPERGNRFGQPPVQQAPPEKPRLAPEDTRVPILPPQARAMRKLPSPLTQYGRPGIQRSPPRPSQVKSGPVVLDKFGNFR